MTHIALFGTSADPPTAGHQKILGWLSHHYDQVRVWASDNPFKSHQTPLEHRAAMLRILIDDIDPPRTNIQLCPELSSPRALITAQKARQIWPGAELTMIIGSDLVSQLSRWYQVEHLFKSVKLLVVIRPGYPLQDQDLEPLRQQGAEVAIAAVEVPDVSSTAYREECNPNIVIPPIEAYIHREQLYTCQGISRESLSTR